MLIEKTCMSDALCTTAHSQLEDGTLVHLAVLLCLVRTVMFELNLAACVLLKYAEYHAAAHMMSMVIAITAAAAAVL
jgi:hypothetical protein